MATNFLPLPLREGGGGRGWVRKKLWCDRGTDPSPAPSLKGRGRIFAGHDGAASGHEDTAHHMSHNTFGHLFRVTTWGESHGPAIGCVVDGCPPRLALSEADIQPWLDRRRPARASSPPSARSPTRSASCPACSTG